MIYIEKLTTLSLGCSNSKDIINRVIHEALNYLKFPYEAEINVYICDNSYIRKINKEYRDIDKATDVLSFPMIEYNTAGDFSIIDEDKEAYLNPETGDIVLGDIMISVEKVITQAIAYGHSNQRELAFLVAHATLHLSGYDHIEDDDRIEMERLQEEILNKCNYTRN